MSVHSCQGSLIACEFLLQNAADVNQRDVRGRGPLHHATCLGHTGWVVRQDAAYCIHHLCLWSASVGGSKMLTWSLTIGIAFAVMDLQTLMCVVPCSLGYVSMCLMSVDGCGWETVWLWLCFMCVFSCSCSCYWNTWMSLQRLIKCISSSTPFQYMGAVHLPNEYIYIFNNLHGKLLMQ